MYRSRSRYKEHDDKEPLDRWLVSYADYVTLMFALFVVLYSLAIAKEEKFKIKKILANKKKHKEVEELHKEMHKESESKATAEETIFSNGDQEDEDEKLF